MAKVKRIGVLTGGGDCPGLNAVIRAVVKSAMHQYGMEVWGIADGFLGLIQDRMRVLSWSDVSNILTLGGTILGTSNQANPERFARRREDGTFEFSNVTSEVVQNLSNRGIEALICIGGDGTMTGSANLIANGINCIGVPKTIDNDLECCDQTFGFDTAVTTATECLDKIHTTAMSHHRVMVVEVMGRNAGWLALSAGVASGSDVILLPEIAYDLKKVCDYVVHRSRSGKQFSIVCISEGCQGGGRRTGCSTAGGVEPRSDSAGGESRKSLRARSRHLLASSPAPRSSGTFSGVARPPRLTGCWEPPLATMLLSCWWVERKAGWAVWRKGKLDDVAIADVAGKQRKVPPDHYLIRAARATGACMGQ